jgi:hypothetical protein
MADRAFHLVKRLLIRSPLPTSPRVNVAIHFQKPKNSKLMNTSHQHLRSTRGGVLVTAFILGLVMFIAAGGALVLSLQNYRASFRKQDRDQAKLILDAEFEKIFYEFLRQRLTIDFTTMPSTIAAGYGNSTIDTIQIPATARPPYLNKHRSDPKWSVRRSIYIDPLNYTTTGYDPISGRPTTYYFCQARVEVIYAGGINGPAFSIKAGRLMSKRINQLIDGAIYYQGDLELNPGGTVTVDGIINVIGNVYIGPLNNVAANVNIESNLIYPVGSLFNQRIDTTDPTNPVTVENVYYNPNATATTNTFKAPQFTSYTDQITARQAQVSQTASAQNIFGGLSPTEIQAENPTLFASVNDVSRSPIVPPPGVTDEYPATITTDDPNISGNRIYNQAGIVVNVDYTGTKNYLIRNASGVLVAANTTQTSALDAAINNLSGTIYDEREELPVRITEVDVSLLNPILSGSDLPIPFNGVMFFNVNGNIRSNTVATNNRLRAVRLINGATTYTRNDTTNNKVIGFTVATNSGLYVKGNYNTTALASGAPGGRTVNPTALAADAITVLSPSWNDANAQNGGLNNKNLVAGRTAGGVVAPASTADGVLPRMTINAAIITGNSSTTSAQRSGGVQNLVRYLEDWSGKQVKFYGAVARLFDSKHFSTAFKSSGDVADVYNQPDRLFQFNTNLVDDGIAGVPNAPTISRGTYYADWSW